MLNANVPMTCKSCVHYPRSTSLRPDNSQTSPVDVPMDTKIKASGSWIDQKIKSRNFASGKIIYYRVHRNVHLLVRLFEQARTIKAHEEKYAHYRECAAFNLASFLFSFHTCEHLE